jgi:2'-5' RNA ligase
VVAEGWSSTSDQTQDPVRSVSCMWFVGAPVSFGDEAGELVPVDADVVATRPADRHVTFAFLGQVEPEIVEQYWSSLPTLDLPRHVHPRRWERFGRSAIALTLADDDLLTAAADACHHAARGLIELRPSDAFRPHVTLARVRRRARPPSSQALRRWFLPRGAIEMGRLTLFRSRAEAHDDRYEHVAQQPPPA